MIGLALLGLRGIAKRRSPTESWQSVERKATSVNGVAAEASFRRSFVEAGMLPLSTVGGSIGTVG